ncbi:MAG: hypothetical protein D6741_14870, partial [Planctomycetota bacterium]
MHTTDRDKSQAVPAVVRSLLATARRAVRRYVIVEAILSVVACLLIGFWVSLWFDWFWEPNRVVRLVVLAGILAVALGVFVRWGVVRLLRRVSDRTLAVLLERQHRDFGESLIT